MSRKKKNRKPDRVSVVKLNGRVRKKLAGLFIAVMLALICLLARITYINATNGESYKRTVLTTMQQRYVNTTIPYKRGDILDRNGTVLASSERVYNLILDCQVANTEIEDSDGNTRQPYRDATVTALVEMFGLDEEELYEKLDSEKTRDSQYQIIKKNVTDEEKALYEAYAAAEDESEEVKAERAYINGVWFEETYMRIYPQGSQACDVIGFANSNGDATWGIEGYYSDVLNGVNGRKFGYFDSDADVQQTTVEAKNGKNVISTIDINIQEIIRGAIIDFQEEYSGEPYFTDGAENIAILVMDPNSGEILGMDSSGWYDLNDPYDIPGVTDTIEYSLLDQDAQTAALNAVWSNYCVSNAYEPGSTAKVITLSAALETASISEDDIFTCDGGEVVNGVEIHCAVWPDDHGILSTADALAASCNDAFMQIAESIGIDSFLDYLDVFNIGKRTGIDLPGENAGSVFTEDTMGALELATSSFGQGFTCTMIQEASAFCAVINGGYYYKPHIVSALTDENGNIVEKIDKVVEKQVVSSEISDFIRSALVGVVDHGTATSSKVDGYSMGGKTGTAEKLPRSDGKFVSTFIGFAPADDPQVVVYVVVDEPNDENQDSSLFAQGIAKEILTELLPYIGLFPDEVMTASGEEPAADETDEPGENVSDGISDENIPAPPEAAEETEETEMDSIFSEGIDNDYASLIQD